MILFSSSDGTNAEFITPTPSSSLEKRKVVMMIDGFDNLYDDGRDGLVRRNESSMIVRLSFIFEDLMNMIN